MKVFDSFAMESLKNVERRLPKTMFKNFLLTTIRQYIVTPELIDAYSDIISTDIFCKQPMTRECVKYLIKNDNFNYNNWLTTTHSGEISILLDDEFVNKYNPNVEPIFNSVKEISREIYNRYFPNANDAVKRLLLTKCKSAEESDIIENISCLLPNDFYNAKISEVVGRQDVLEKIFTDCNMTNLVSFLVLLSHYSCIQFSDSFTMFNFDTFDDDTLVKYEKYYDKLLTSIITSYPVDAVGSIFVLINQSNPRIFQLSGMDIILKYYLATCNNIDEGVLICLINTFAVNGLLEELKNYGKNYNYKELLLALALN